MELKQAPRHAEHFKRILSRKSPPRKTNLETTLIEAPADFKESDILDRLGYSHEGLYKIIEKYLGNDPALKELADRVIGNGVDPLRAVANNDNAFFARHPQHMGTLEIIVKTDGSRPSFLITNGTIDYDSSPVGDWKPKLEEIKESIKNAIQCVGRININQRQIGTGFLIHRNLVVTNRHVLQAIGICDANGNWTINPAANIDFGYEYNGNATLNLRRLKNLVYCAPQAIDLQNVDHQKLDMAILEAEAVPDDMVPATILQWNSQHDWAFPDTVVYTIGYPGDPGLAGIANYTETLLDRIFRSTYGLKRLAPGMVMSEQDAAWTLSHDATTLGGNSGSVVVADGREKAASGIHYGGELADPRRNWGHVFGSILEVKNIANQTLEEVLQARQVEIFK